MVIHGCQNWIRNAASTDIMPQVLSGFVLSLNSMARNLDAIPPRYYREKQMTYLQNGASESKLTMMKLQAHKRRLRSSQKMQSESVANITLALQQPRCVYTWSAASQSGKQKNNNCRNSQDHCFKCQWFECILVQVSLVRLSTRSGVTGSSVH